MWCLSRKSRKLQKIQEKTRNQFCSFEPAKTFYIKNFPENELLESLYYLTAVNFLYNQL